MNPLDIKKQRLEVLKEFVSRFAQPDKLTPHQAALYSRNFRHQMGSKDIYWSDQLSIEQIKDVQRLLHASQIAEECGETALQKQCLTRAAQILEWLQNTNDTFSDTIPFSYLSAACYQLSGLPAMAMNAITNSEDPAAKVLSDFLKANLNKIPIQTTQYWVNRLDSDPEQQINYVDDMIRSIGIISNYLSTGDDDRLTNAIEKLNELNILALNGVDGYEWLLYFLINKVANKYTSDSIWVVLQQLKSTVNDEGWHRLVLFSSQSCRRNKYLLWPSQKLGIERLALKDSFAMCTPTGSGKTTVAHLAIIQSLFEQTTQSEEEENEISPLVIYLVPSRALAAEAEGRLVDSIRKVAPGVIVTGLYGGSDWSITDAWLTSETPTVLVCTVEKAEALLRYLGSLLLRRLSLIVIDEAHQVGFDSSEYSVSKLVKGECREQRLESFVSRLLTNCPMCRVVALSAVAGGIEGTIAKWITGKEDAQPVGGLYRSTRQFIGNLSYRSHGNAQIILEILDGSRLQLQDRSHEAFVPLGFPSPPLVDSSIRNSLYQYNDCYTSWVAAHFALAKKKVLISITERIELTLEVINEAINQWSEYNVWPSYFSEKTLTETEKELFDRCLASSIDYCGELSLEVSLLKKGIAVHHGQLPMKVRRLMTMVIERGITPVTIATSTLTEGVNLPFDIVLLPRVAREPFNSSKNRRDLIFMNPSEFLNLAGRAGRPGLGSEGMTLIVTPETPSTTAPRQRETQMIQVHKLQQQCKEMLDTAVIQQECQIRSPLAQLIHTIFKQWSILVDSKNIDDFYIWLEQTINLEEIPSEDLVGALDSFDEFLLSALHEAEQLREIPLDGEKVEKIMKELWRHTFAFVSLTQQKNIFEAIMERRGVAIFERLVPEKEDRHRIYRLGLSIQKAKRFEPFREAVQTHLQTGFSYSIWNEEDQFAFIKGLVELVSQNADFKFSSRHSQISVKDWPIILKWWLSCNDAEKPIPREVRHWLDFCNSNFDFKVSVATGAVISDIWAERSEPGDIPSLRNWVDIMDLPWIAFWIRELIRWGTTDPFVAFVLSKGHTDNRQEALQLKSSYRLWYLELDETGDQNDLISPIRFRDWERSRFDTPIVKKKRSLKWDVKSITSESKEEKIRVFPVINEERILWFDVAGYLVAESKGNMELNESQVFSSVFWLNLGTSKVTCRY